MKVTTKTVTIETHQLQVSKQDFLDFLDSRMGAGVARKYAYNVLFRGRADIFTFHPYRWLDVAFTWLSTPEGDKFWQAVDQSWSSYLTTRLNEARKNCNDPEMGLVSAEKKVKGE